MTHTKKVWIGYFDKILEGKKNFELRLADWECTEGDILILKEWDNKNNRYTGREIRKEITYVLKTKDVDFWNKEEIEKYGLQIISFK